MKYLNCKREVALILLERGVVRLRPEEPFVWRSGIRAPIYCDPRELLSFPKERKKIVNIFVGAIREVWPKVEVIAGVATGGVPFATLIAHRMNLPLIYVQKEGKGHGREKRVEGRLPPKKRNIAVIDDVISTGGSLFSAVTAIKQEAIVNVMGFCIFNYGLREFQKRFFQGDIGIFSLTNLDALLEVATEKKIYKRIETELVEKWRDNLRVEAAKSF